MMRKTITAFLSFLSMVQMYSATTTVIAHGNTPSEQNQFIAPVTALYSLQVEGNPQYAWIFEIACGFNGYAMNLSKGDIIHFGWEIGTATDATVRIDWPDVPKPEWKGANPYAKTLYAGNYFEISLANFSGNICTFQWCEGETPPTWMTLNWDTGLITGTVPANEPSAEHLINFYATNAWGASDPVTLSVLINTMQDGFYFTCPSNKDTAQGNNFIYTISTNKSENVTYAVEQLPSWLHFSGTTISGVVPSDAGQSYAFQISAYCEQYGAITQTVSGEISTSSSTTGSKITNWDEISQTAWWNSLNSDLKTMAQYQLNTKDAITNAGTSIKSEISQSNSQLNLVNGNLNEIENKLATTNGNLNEILNAIYTYGDNNDAKLDDISAGIRYDLSGVVQNSANEIVNSQNQVINAVDGVIDAINKKEFSANVTMDFSDLENTLTQNSGVPEMETDVKKPDIKSANIPVTIFNNYMNGNYSNTAPKWELSLESINQAIQSFGSESRIEPIIIDFSKEPLNSIAKGIREFELGLIFLAGLWALYRLIKTFEY